MERERECKNSVRKRQLCSGDVGFDTWRSSSYQLLKNGIMQTIQHSKKDMGGCIIYFWFVQSNLKREMLNKRLRKNKRKCIRVLFPSFPPFLYKLSLSSH